MGYKGIKYMIQGCYDMDGYPLKEGRGGGHYVLPFNQFGINVIHAADPKEEAILFEHKAKKISELGVFTPDFVKKAFETLENELSPENLHCDGEITNAQAAVKERKIRRLWAALEDYIGEKVDAYT